MDTTKLGVATAKAMDDLERFAESGDIPEGARIGAVVIVVALDHDTPDDAEDRYKLRDVSTQVFCFSEPEEIYVQLGLLGMAQSSYVTAD